MADVNNLRLNPLKTRELIVFKSPNRRVNSPINQVICCSDRFQSFLGLSVVISSDLRMSFHIDQVTSSCASSLYARRVFRSHDLKTPKLHEVARTTTVASLLHCCRLVFATD